MITKISFPPSPAAVFVRAFGLLNKLAGVVCFNYLLFAYRASVENMNIPQKPEKVFSVPYYACHFEFK